MSAYFEPIDIDSVNEEELDAYPDRFITQTIAWVKFLAHTQKADPVIAALRVGGRNMGYFTGLIVERFGLRILASPYRPRLWTTMYMGFNLKPGVSRAGAVQALKELAFDTSKCQHLILGDRYLTDADYDPREFETTIHPGYEIDLTLSEDQLFRNMKHACRGCVRKANKCGVIVEEADDSQFVEDYYAQIVDLCACKRAIPDFGCNHVKALIYYLRPTGRLLLLRAINKEGFCIATGIFSAMNRTVLFWGSASWRCHSDVRPNEALMWYAMRYWKARGMSRLDMGGEGDYKVKYGARPIFTRIIELSKNAYVRRLRDTARFSVRKWHHVTGSLALLRRKLIGSRNP